MQPKNRLIIILSPTHKLVSIAYPVYNYRISDTHSNLKNQISDLKIVASFRDNYKRKPQNEKCKTNVSLRDNSQDMN